MAYMVFDLLHLEGQSLVDVPLEHRKHLLRRVLRPDGLVRYASHVVGRRRRLHAGGRRQGTGGGRGQAPRQPVPTWPAQPRLAEDQAAPRAGDRGRRLAAGAGDPQGPGLADRGRERRRRSAPCRTGGQRHQRPDAQGAAGRHGADPAAGPAAGQEATAAAGALGRAADRDPRRVHRLDARRAAAPGRVQGDRAGSRSGQGRARRGDPGRAGRAAGAASPTAGPASARLRRAQIRPPRQTAKRRRLGRGVATGGDGPHARQPRRAEGAGRDGTTKATGRWPATRCASPTWTRS